MTALEDFNGLIQRINIAIAQIGTGYANRNLLGNGRFQLYANGMGGRVKRKVNAIARNRDRIRLSKPPQTPRILPHRRNQRAFALRRIDL